jgi:hypothetical protein
LLIAAARLWIHILLISIVPKHDLSILIGHEVFWQKRDLSSSASISKWFVKKRGVALSINGDSPVLQGRSFCR